MAATTKTVISPPEKGSLWTTSLKHTITRPPSSPPLSNSYFEVLENTSVETGKDKVIFVTVFKCKADDTIHVIKTKKWFDDIPEVGDVYEWGKNNFTVIWTDIKDDFFVLKREKQIYGLTLGQMLIKKRVESKNNKKRFEPYVLPEPVFQEKSKALFERDIPSGGPIWDPEKWLAKNKERYPVRIGSTWHFEKEHYFIYIFKVDGERYYCIGYSKKTENQRVCPFSDAAYVTLDVIGNMEPFKPSPQFKFNPLPRVGSFFVETSCDYIYHEIERVSEKTGSFHSHAYSDAHTRQIPQDIVAGDWFSGGDKYKPLFDGLCIRDKLDHIPYSPCCENSMCLSVSEITQFRIQLTILHKNGKPICKNAKSIKYSKEEFDCLKKKKDEEEEKDPSTFKVGDICIQKHPQSFWFSRISDITPDIYKRKRGVYRSNVEEQEVLKGYFLDNFVHIEKGVEVECVKSDLECSHIHESEKISYSSNTDKNVVLFCKKKDNPFIHVVTISMEQFLLHFKRKI